MAGFEHTTKGDITHKIPFYGDECIVMSAEADSDFAEKD